MALFRLHAHLPESASLILENALALLRGLPVRFSKVGDGMYAASDGTFTRYFGSLRRGFWLYRDGLEKRGSDILSSYCLQNISFDPDDAIVDCGANYGDLFIMLRDRVKHENYIAVEPSPKDFHCLSLNWPQALKLNIALGNENGQVEFFLQSEDGDSSVIEPKNYTGKVMVQATRLDDLYQVAGRPRIKLLKLEAEGFEPEILEGGLETLNKCEYVAIDGGYERGKSEDQTFSTLSNVLIQHGFEMQDIYLPYCRALFRNADRGGAGFRTGCYATPDLMD